MIRYSPLLHPQLSQVHSLKGYSQTRQSKVLSVTNLSFVFIVLLLVWYDAEPLFHCSNDGCSCAMIRLSNASCGVSPVAFAP